MVDHPTEIIYEWAKAWIIDSIQAYGDSFERFDPHNISCPDGIVERMLMAMNVFCAQEPGINQVKYEITSWIQELNSELEPNPYMSELEGAAKQTEKQVRDRIWNQLVTRKLEGKTPEKRESYITILSDVCFMKYYLQPIQYQGKKQRMRLFKRHSHKKGRKHSHHKKRNRKQSHHKKGNRKISHKIGRKHSHKKH